MALSCSWQDPVVGDASTETQHYTLLDGEMVIDRDPDTGNVEQKYLVYDVMMINQKQLTKVSYSEEQQSVAFHEVYRAVMVMCKVNLDGLIHSFLLWHGCRSCHFISDGG